MIRRETRLAGGLLIAAGCGLLLWWFVAALPVWVRLAIGAFAVLAFVRPFDALMLFAGVGPVGGPLLGLAGSSAGGGSVMEAMALAMFASSAVRAGVRAKPLRLTDFECAGIVFGALAAASCLAQWPTRTIQAGVANPISTEAGRMLRNYFDRPVELTPVFQSLQFIEGIGIAALTARLIDAGRGIPLAAAALSGAAGVALLNVERLVEVALRQGAFFPAIRSALWNLRVSTQYGDLNAAGSYFAMMAVASLVLARTESTVRRLAIAACVVTCAGLWMSGSRIALASAILSATFVFAFEHRAASLASVHRRAIVLATALVLLAGAMVMLFTNPGAGRARFGYSVFSRIELVKTGFRMAAERPIFGVGISQFYERFPRYSSPELREAFAHASTKPVTHENAHNNLMQILAELGTAGLAAFALLLAVALRRSEGGPASPEGLAALAGVAAFLLTCLGGHPLLTPMVAFPFWLMLGIAAAGAAPLGQPMRTYLRPATVLVVVLLVTTLPLRARYDRRDADLEGASLGFSKWEQNSEGRRFRRATRASLFVASTTRFVTIPLRSPDDRPRRVSISLDGRPVSETVVPGGVWIDSRLILPGNRDAPRFRRIDLLASPDAGEVPGEDRAVLVGRVSETPPD